ncbi:MAG: hypothetical protein N3A69_11820, partial [Leptospiraceae bacterium]|nr:hypothetical protein [Leptospiraceae bacterium]
AYSVFALEDGKILATGDVSNNFYDNIPTVIRYLSNGSIDTSFGNNGIYVNSEAGSSKVAALDKNGRLLMPAKNSNDDTIVIRIR